mmetsp:Transcript_7974/g.28046  ORF Transcript_7974/g.28046 Transcript_7974/m.28046 type:complete len:213 (-) Transcript_7974:62-700(-)
MSFFWPSVVLHLGLLAEVELVHGEVDDQGGNADDGADGRRRRDARLEGVVAPHLDHVSGLAVADLRAVSVLGEDAGEIEALGLLVTELHRHAAVGEIHSGLRRGLALLVLRDVVLGLAPRAVLLAAGAVAELDDRLLRAGHAARPVDGHCGVARGERAVALVVAVDTAGGAGERHGDVGAQGAQWHASLRAGNEGEQREGEELEGSHCEVGC